MSNDQDRLLQLLREQPRTRRQLEIDLGVGAAAVSKRLKRLRTPDNTLVCIVAYVEHPDGVRGLPAPVYGPGDGQPDVPAPPATSHRERNEAYQRRDPARFKALRKQARQRAATRAKARRAALFAGLGARKPRGKKRVM